MRILLSVCALIISSGCLAADKQKIFNDIYEADQVFFTAFNSCNLKTMGSIFSKELEFYHDISGYSNYDQTMKTTKSNCDRKLGLTRELVDNSMVVYRLDNFGAIQKGRHKFCHEVDGKADCGTFEFLHIWKKNEGKWSLHRVVSYDH